MYRVTELRRVGLSLVRPLLPLTSYASSSSTKLSSSSAGGNILSFGYASDAQEREYAARVQQVWGSGGGYGGADRQNTDEQGVFISNAALQKLKEDRERKAREQAAAAVPARRLLSMPAAEAHVVHVLTSSSSSPSSSPSSSRHLLAASSSSTRDVSVTIIPGSIVAYLFRLMPVSVHGSGDGGKGDDRDTNSRTNQQLREEQQMQQEDTQTQTNAGEKFSDPQKQRQSSVGSKGKAADVGAPGHRFHKSHSLRPRVVPTHVSPFQWLNEKMTNKQHGNEKNDDNAAEDSGGNDEEAAYEVGDDDENVLVTDANGNTVRRRRHHDHHTTFPARAHSIIPSHLEYVVILCASTASLMLLTSLLGLCSWSNNQNGGSIPKRARAI